MMESHLRPAVPSSAGHYTHPAIPYAPPQPHAGTQLPPPPPAQPTYQPAAPATARVALPPPPPPPPAPTQPAPAPQPARAPPAPVAHHTVPQQTNGHPAVAAPPARPQVYRFGEASPPVAVDYFSQVAAAQTNNSSLKFDRTQTAPVVQPPQTVTTQNGIAVPFSSKKHRKPHGSHVRGTKRTSMAAAALARFTPNTLSRMLTRSPNVDLTPSQRTALAVAAQLNPDVGIKRKNKFSFANIENYSKMSTLIKDLKDPEDKRNVQRAIQAVIKSSESLHHILDVHENCIRGSIDEEYIVIYFQLHQPEKDSLEFSVPALVDRVRHRMKNIFHDLRLAPMKRSMFDNNVDDKRPELHGMHCSFSVHLHRNGARISDMHPPEEDEDLIRVRKKRKMDSS